MSKEASNIDYLSAAEKYWLGSRLHASHQLRGYAIPEAARLLDLSQAQVLAIEAGNQGPFAHTSHYVQCVRRYASSMNTPQSTEVLNWIECADDSSATEVAASSQIERINKLLRARLTNDVTMLSREMRFNRFSSLNISIALIVLGFVMTMPLAWTNNYTENSRIEAREFFVQLVYSGSPDLEEQTSD